ERGTAITDPLALRELDGGRFGLGAMLAPAQSSNMPLDNRDLFALASMVPVRKALDDEFDKYVARHSSDLPNETIGVGASFDLQLHGAELAQKLPGRDGPLDLVAPENIARIETNLQVAHAPKTSARDFRTDYLMKVFDYNGRSAEFVEVSLENQIDRDRLLGD